MQAYSTRPIAYSIFLGAEIEDESLGSARCLYSNPPQQGGKSLKRFSLVNDDCDVDRVDEW